MITKHGGLLHRTGHGVAHASSAVLLRWGIGASENGVVQGWPLGDG